MAENITINRKRPEVVLLFDTYGPDGKNLHKSFRSAGDNSPVVVIEDDGFLPDDVTGVYSYFLGSFKDKPGVPGQPRYFNQIKVPEYWEISGNNSGGKVQDLSHERGRIFYAEPLHKRLVKVVDWLSDTGVVRSSDHYNRYGALYARTTFNHKGQKVNKSYFDAEGREIIVENFVTGNIILNHGQEVKIFANKTELVVYFIQVAGYANCRIFFNSLSTPFFVSQKLPAGNAKKDMLFWQEPVRDAIPGNMQIILNGQASRTEKIMVQKKQAYERLIELGASKDVVRKLGFIYAFEKENRHRPDVLICTNSDRIEQCEKLIQNLPMLHFHITALTEMSSKLMAMGNYNNTTLYPGVKMSILEELFKQCDYYLDINHEGEIVNAVNRAFLNDHLIMAFRETMHNRDYVADEHIYTVAETDRMIADLKNYAADAKLMGAHIDIQRKAAMAETPAKYGKRG